MNQQMFCFQCEQTAGGKGCQIQGVCGKKPTTANLQDELTGALIGLARACSDNTYDKDTIGLLIEGLFTTITNVNFNDETIKRIIDRTRDEKERIAGGKTYEDYNMKKIWDGDEDIRSLKSLILFGVRGMAAYAYHARVLGYTDKEVDDFFVKALCTLGEDHTQDWLLSVVMEVGTVNYKCMALLDKANTETFGNPEPTKVPLTIEKGPFIVISGHDLYDLKLLLEQTKDKFTPTVRCFQPMLIRSSRNIRI